MASTTVIDAKDAAKIIIESINRNYRWFTVPDDLETRREFFEDWAYAFSHVRYPDFVWKKAIRSILMHAQSNDNPPMPGDVLNACRRVVDGLRGDELAALEWIREQRRREMDERIRQSQQNGPK